MIAPLRGGEGNDTQDISLSELGVFGVLFDLHIKQTGKEDQESDGKQKEQGNQSPSRRRTHLEKRTAARNKALV